MYRPVFATGIILSLLMPCTPAARGDRAIDPPSSSATSASTLTVEESAPGWTWRGAIPISDSQFHGGTAMAGGPNLDGFYTFHGSAVTVIGVGGPAVFADGRSHKSGKLRVILDGHQQLDASLYRPSGPESVSAFKIDNLTDANHVLEVQAIGGWIALDYVIIGGIAVDAGNTPAPATHIDFSRGFANASDLKFNGYARSYGSGILMTDGHGNEASSIFFSRPVQTASFTTHFRFQFASNTAGDGLTFCLQGNGPAAIGAWGGEMGYKGIDRSIAVKFDLFDNFGEGKNSTGLFANGAYPALPATDLTRSGIDLHNGNPIDVTISYDGKVLTVSECDAVTRATASQTYTIDIPACTGTRAYAGFTASMGGAISTLFISTWTM